MDSEIRELVNRMIEVSRMMGWWAAKIIDNEHTQYDGNRVRNALNEHQNELSDQRKLFEELLVRVKNMEQNYQ